MYQRFTANRRHVTMAFATLLLSAAMATAQPVRPGGQSGGGGGGGGREMDIGPEDPEKLLSQARNHAERAMKNGREQREKGRVRPAIVSFKSAVNFALNVAGEGGPADTGIAQAAIGELQQIQQEGIQKLEAARKAYEEGKFLEARDESLLIKNNYGGILEGVPGIRNAPNLAIAAKDLVKRIESDPKAADALQTAKATPLIKRLARLDREVKREPAKRLDVYQLLGTLSEKFPQCAAGRDAARRLEDMRKDTALMAWIDREIQVRKVRSDLAAADQYERSGNAEKAEQLRADLLKRYPGKTLAQLRDEVAK